MRSRTALPWLTSLLLALAVASGCQRTVAPVKVEGVVTLDGQPVADAEVTFILDGKDGKAVTGKTDAQGAFVVMVVPSNYKIVLYKHADGPNPLQSALPNKYREPGTSPFNCVAPPPNKLTLALQSGDAP